MPPKIVIIGSFSTDLVTYMPMLPQIGETVPAHRFITGPGGKGSNQAVGAARLGADVTFIGCVGKDNFANLAYKLWEQENINVKYVTQDKEHATGIASIFVEDGGEDMIAIASGSNMALSPAHIDAAAEAITAADVLITQLEIRQDTVAHALKLARRKGVTTILNPAPADKLSPEFLALADYLTPNETEVEKLGGHYADTAEEAAQKLLAHDTQTIIVTMGAWGALWVRKSEHGHVTTYSVEAVDTVGAGDAFNAGLAVGLAEKKPLPDAIAFANAAAALAVTRKGAAESMPTRSEVDTFLAKNQEAESDE